MTDDITSLLVSLSTMILPVIIAITLHEAAHGWVAHKLGDDMAKRAGRVTFNPVRHIDKVGTVILPISLFLVSGGKMIFGWAKPVPVDPRCLRQPRRDMILVAAAGPVSNIAMAIVAAALFHVNEFLPDSPDFPLRSWVYWNLGHAVYFNILLAVFNMLPVPPLDGGRVMVGLLPQRAAMAWAKLEPMGIFIVLGLFFLVPFVTGQLGYTVNPAYWLVILPSEFLAELVGKLVFIR